MSNGNYVNNLGTIEEFWGSFSQCEQIISEFNLRIYRKFEENKIEDKFAKYGSLINNYNSI
jgi:hypothetical protein